MGGPLFRRQATCYSVIASIIAIEATGYQFMVFAGDGSNSLPGVHLHQGVDDRVPIRVGRYGRDWYSSFRRCVCLL